MINFLALVVVLLAGLYLLILALVAFLKPEKASGFLLGFASSASFHYLELSIRMVIGVAFVVRAPLTMFPEILTIFGWVLIGTTACLFLIPWQWHQKFSKWSVPQALRQLNLVAISSLALGGFIIFAAIPGSAT
ncbi:MAG: hypothetical protein ABI644_11035 [Arenimonas sp.]